jgi:hypothetical protein
VSDVGFAMETQVNARPHRQTDHVPQAMASSRSEMINDQKRHGLNILN